MISFYIIPLLVAMFLAINMGASGTAPSFAASYGANIIRKDMIPGLFGIFVFAGAVIAGGKVIETVGGDILPSESVTTIVAVIVLGSVALSLLFANILKVPQSTSQSTIFALVGVSAYLNILQTDRLFIEIIPTWFVTPVLAFAISYLAGRFIYLPLRDRLQHILHFLRNNNILKYFVLVTSCYVAFAIGANNMANAAAPVISMSVNMLGVEAGSDNYILLMLIVVFMVAPFFGIGSSLMGGRVLDTTGKNIVSFGSLGASYISFITATILLVASLWRGIPTSLVQMNTAAIIGVGMIKNGFSHTWEKAPLKKIFIIWLAAPIIAMILALLFTWIADTTGLMAYKSP